MAVTNQLWKSVLVLMASVGSLPLLNSGATLAQSTFPPQPPACLTGYPDGPYRGEQPLTRDEFAAGMNACLPQMTPRERLLLLQPERANLASRDDFKVLIERQRALNQQLRDLSDRVGNLADPQPKPATSE